MMDLQKIGLNRPIKHPGKIILFTGPPRCGKSTLIQKLIRKIEKPMTGFYTAEIRDKGKRVGFSLTTLDGRNGILAHKGIKGPYRVGKYGVNIEDIDRIAVPSLIPSKPDEIIVIDEIGKMECLSPLFKKTLVSVIDSDHRVIGSVAQWGDRFIQKIKERRDVHLVCVSQENRERLIDIFTHDGTIDRPL